MKRGKHICETLKEIRAEVARVNEIEYSPTPCTHDGECSGTCPACEHEVRQLERQLRLRRQLGKAVTIAGISLGVGAMSPLATGMPCQPASKAVEQPDSTECVVMGIVPAPRYFEACFPGGEEELNAHLAELITLPDNLKLPKKVIVAQLSLDSVGTVTDVEITRDPIQNPVVNAIITEALLQLPPFIPATDNGHPVESTYRLFINPVKYVRKTK
ncbi:MAG: hypothetical protein IJT30_11830 [Muribaculaceae bacterium]|nr:hypothetical protein [Muribaculaceae bacterium]